MRWILRSNAKNKINSTGFGLLSWGWWFSGGWGRSGWKFWVSGWVCGFKKVHWIIDCYMWETPIRYAQCSSVTIWVTVCDCISRCKLSMLKWWEQLILVWHGWNYRKIGHSISSLALLKLYQSYIPLCLFLPGHFFKFPVRNLNISVPMSNWNI